MPRRTPRIFYVLLGLYIAITFAYEAAGTASFLVGYFDLRDQVKEPFQLRFPDVRITGLRDSAKAAGLRVGDTVEILNGQPCCERVQWHDVRWYARPDQVWRVTVRRSDGARATVTIPLEPDTPTATPSEAMFLITLQVAIPTLCLFLGYWVGLARPWDPNAWLILLLLSFPQVFITVSSYNWWPGAWLALRLYWHLILLLTVPIALLLFGLLFPERSFLDRRLPWLKWAVIAVIGCSAGIELLAEYTEWYDHTFLPPLLTLEPYIDAILNWVMLVCVAIYWVAIFAKLKTTSTPDAYRRMRVLCAGSVVGLGPVLVIWGLFPRFGLDPARIHWLAYTSAVLMSVFPFSLAYVVVVQRAMDVRILLRIGTRYILARTTLVIFEVVVAALLITRFVVPFLVRRQNEALGIVLLALSGAVVLRTSMSQRNPAERIRVWLDRRFFREAYNTELVLSELAGRIRSITDPAVLIETISRRISDVLHVEQGAVLLRSGEVFRLQRAFGMPNNGELTLPANSAPVQRLVRTNSPALLYQDTERVFAGMQDAVRDALQSMRAEVLLPFHGREGLMGMMLLGPKRSEEPYSPTDLRLLASLGAQTGLALEVSELANSLAREAAHRERIQREMEIAREVQERLFPQQLPCIQGIDPAGHCRPALGVGGDYYDMIAMQDGRLALAIGDVSGKGIAAALLMASVRAYLHGIVDDGSADLARMMRRLNRLVYDSSSSNRYATFFFAVYDPARRDLRYVNCGHNPPFVVRVCGEATRLEASGPVIGLLPGAEYAEQTITLASGDLLLAYTDGISEAMTRDDEEWGEERMFEAAMAARKCCSRQILEAIFSAADEFTAGAPQYDDMTLLVMQLRREQPG